MVSYDDEFEMTYIHSTTMETSTISDLSTNRISTLKDQSYIFDLGFWSILSETTWDFIRSFVDQVWLFPLFSSFLVPLMSIFV